MAGLVLVNVANRVLTKLGARRLVSLAEGGESAGLFHDNVDGLRRHEIRRYRWNFAITRASVPALGAAPAWGWLRAFPEPSDCLRVVQVGDDPDDEPPYQLEGRSIFTDAAAPLRFRYLRDEPDPAKWDAAFAEVLACRMAVELCDRVTQSGPKKQALIAEYQAALADARRLDAIEDEPQALAGASNWLEARLNG